VLGEVLDLSPNPHSHSLNPSCVFPEIAGPSARRRLGWLLPGLRASDFANAMSDRAPTFAKEVSTLRA
jgi:hypothetical protein